MAKKSDDNQSFIKKIFKFLGNIFRIINIIIVTICVGIPVLLLVIEFFGLFLGYDIASSEKAADGFTIDSYNVVLDVKEDNKIDVTENITVNWNETNHHGIYKFTPLWLKYTPQDGKTVQRKSIIYNYRAIDEPYIVDTVNGKERIKIGSANTFVDYGLKTYVIKYTYDMGRDPFKGFDELIFHAFGDYWGTEINNASIMVNMPKSIEGYNIKFFTDKLRKKDVTDVVDYEVNGNSLYARFDKIKNTLKGNKPLSGSLTVDIELPEGYFVGGSWNYGWYSFAISMLIFLLTLWTIYKWIRFGKDYSKQIETVEFYPPDNLNAAEVGYIINNKESSKKFTIALIVQLASKGYLKIDELKDQNNKIQITNLCLKPKEVQDVFIDRKIKVKKLKDKDDNLSKEEIEMMDNLFKKGNTKEINSNIIEFLKVKDRLVKDGYIKVIKDNMEDKLAEELKFKESLEEYNKKIDNLSELEKIVYTRLFEKEDVVILSEHKTLYKAFNDVNDKLNKDFKNKFYDNKASKQYIYAIVRGVIIFLLSVISYSLIKDLDPSWRILYYLAFSCNIINLVFILIMKRKTEYGEYITARVNGFKNFLVTAEKERLEALVMEDPNYFYNILPYTYVMNISKKWISKFEDIPVPKLDMGTYDYTSDYSFLYNDVYTPSSNSGSSSSCGGGCSSCGGGCSSCGGGGSW